VPVRDNDALAADHQRGSAGKVAFFCGKRETVSSRSAVGQAYGLDVNYVLEHIMGTAPRLHLPRRRYTLSKTLLKVAI